MSCGENCSCGGSCGCNIDQARMESFSMKLNKIAIAKQNVEALNALLGRVESGGAVAKEANEALLVNVKCLKEIENL